MTVPAARVALVCTGLGRVERGFETFTAELFGELEHRVALTLLKGGGAARPNQVTIPNLPRDRALRWHPGLGGHAYRWEQRTFAVGMLPTLLRRRFDLIHYMDGGLTGPLLRFRRLGFRYKLVFKNGGAHTPEHYDRADYIQLLTPMQLEEARAHGIPEERLFCIPLGIDCAAYAPTETPDRGALRRRYQVPAQATVVLCVSALSVSDKRLDWVIREVAAMPRSDVFLVLAGHQGPESPAVLALAAELLPDRHCVLQVPFARVRDLYWLADVMALGSVREGFGRVVPEAASAGLPLVVHDSPHFRWMTGHPRAVVDMTRAGALAARLMELLDDPGLCSEIAKANLQRVRAGFDWSCVRPMYEAMYATVARG